MSGMEAVYYFIIGIGFILHKLKKMVSKMETPKDLATTVNIYQDKDLKDKQQLKH